jgi:hypothetical protein
MPPPASAQRQPLKRPRAAEASSSSSRRRARASATTTPAQAPLPPFRLEYGASGPPTSVALADFLQRHRGQITGVHIANKDAGDRLLERAEALIVAATTTKAATTTTPSQPLEICLHYSLKLQGGRGDESVRRLSGFLERAARLLGARNADGGSLTPDPNAPPRCSVLLVSGSGDPRRRPKGQLCTVEALERLAEARKKNPAPPSALPPLYVAFNPYFPDPQEREQEQQRLRRKLATGLVTGGVALQFGADANLLEKGLAFLRGEEDGDGGGNSGTTTTTILGSIFLPTKRFLAQMRFRPWRGVFLKEAGFLESVEEAERCCAATLRVYRAFGVVPLVETAVEVEEEKQTGLGAVEELLRLGG